MVKEKLAVSGEAFEVSSGTELQHAEQAGWRGCVISTRSVPAQMTRSHVNEMITSVSRCRSDGD
jgi:hypothetical protein